MNCDVCGKSMKLLLTSYYCEWCSFKQQEAYIEEIEIPISDGNLISDIKTFGDQEVQKFELSNWTAETLYSTSTIFPNSGSRCLRLFDYAIGDHYLRNQEVIARQHHTNMRLPGMLMSGQEFIANGIYIESDCSDEAEWTKWTFNASARMVYNHSVYFCGPLSTLTGPSLPLYEFLDEARELKKDNQPLFQPFTQFVRTKHIGIDLRLPIYLRSHLMFHVDLEWDIPPTKPFQLRLHLDGLLKTPVI